MVFQDEDGLVRSVLRVPASSAALGQYQCRVDNQIGEGEPCFVDVQGFFKKNNSN